MSRPDCNQLHALLSFQSLAGDFCPREDVTSLKAEFIVAIDDLVLHLVTWFIPQLRTTYVRAVLNYLCWIPAT